MGSLNPPVVGIRPRSSTAMWVMVTGENEEVGFCGFVVCVFVVRSPGSSLEYLRYSKEYLNHATFAPPRGGRPDGAGWFPRRSGKTAVELVLLWWWYVGVSGCVNESTFPSGMRKDRRAREGRWVSCNCHALNRFGGRFIPSTAKKGQQTATTHCQLPAGRTLFGTLSQGRDGGTGVAVCASSRCVFLAAEFVVGNSVRRLAPGALCY